MHLVRIAVKDNNMRKAEEEKPSSFPGFPRGISNKPTHSCRPCVVALQISINLLKLE